VSIFSVPRTQIPDEPEIMEMRVLHEVTHYYLQFTILLSGVYREAEKILEVAGREVAVFILEYIGECLAHAETARICGPRRYFSSSSYRPNVVPTAKAPSGSPTTFDEEFLFWRRRKEKSFFFYTQFGCVSPWAWAAELFEEDTYRNSFLQNLHGQALQIHNDLAQPMREIYNCAALKPEPIFKMVRIIEDTFWSVSLVSTGNSLETLISHYREQGAFRDLFGDT